MVAKFEDTNFLQVGEPNPGLSGKLPKSPKRHPRKTNKGWLSPLTPLLSVIVCMYVLLARSESECSSED